MSDYELKRINALTEASAINDSDVFAIDSAAGTKKVAWETLKGEVDADISEAVSNKADKDGTYPDMAVGSVLGTNTVTDNEPYFLRPSASIGDREFDTLVGGSLGWNQLCNGSSVTVESGHKYYMIKGGTASVGASDGTAITGLTSGTDIVIDLTIDFGSTIADYIYSLETAHTGDGVAWVRKYLPNDYYAYCAPTLKHVSGVSAHVMRDANNNVIGNYPIDSTWTGMGVPKLDSANKLYFDGDTYASDGTVTRKYKVATYNGTEAWVKDRDTTGYSRYYLADNTVKVLNNYIGNILNSKGYDIARDYTFGDRISDIAISAYPFGSGSNWVYFGFKTTLNINTVEDFKAWLANNPVSVVLPLATPTTSSASPFTSPQICDPNGTEEYVTTGLVPVGHETEYVENLADKLTDIPDLPTTAGTYSLKVTVSGGVPSYSWVSA